LRVGVHFTGSKVRASGSPSSKIDVSSDGFKTISEILVIAYCKFQRPIAQSIINVESGA